MGLKYLDVHDNNIQNDFVIGDIHGQFEEFVYAIVNYEKITDANIIVLGDIGMGFYKENYYYNILKKINTKLKKNNINLFFFRGNHDDPQYFKDGKYNKSNIFFIDDYTIIKTLSHSILCVGGARSIDKCVRWKWDKITQKIVTDGWWEGERVIPIPENFDKDIQEYKDIDIICTHCAPSNVEYDTKGIPNEYIIKDETLLDEIKIDQEILYNLWEIVKPSKWYYGHYHHDKTEVVDETIFRACKDFVAGYYKTPLVPLY